MSAARLELENEQHYRLKAVAEPDYLHWTPFRTATFSYGYFSPESRVRLRLICPDEPVNSINVASAVLEGKVFTDSLGIRRVKTVCDIPISTALKLFASASRALGKTIRSYARPEGTWELGFEPGTYDLISIELDLGESTDVDLPIPPNFIGEPFSLVGPDKFYTYDQASLVGETDPPQ